MNFILILLGCLIPLCLARRENEVHALSTKKLMKKNFFNTFTSGSRLQNHRPRDSGYFYPKPSGLRVVNSGSKRFKPARVKPFRTYGPPAEPQIASNKPTHQNQPLKFEDTKKLPQLFTHQPVHSLVLSHAIANQNEEPFKHSANYLPPQNQRLPGYFTDNKFSRDHLNTQNQVYNVENSAISDAAQFLTQNSHAIAQLYENALKDSQQQHQNDQSQPVNDLKTVEEFNRPLNSIFKHDRDVEEFRNTQNHGNFLASQDLSSFTPQSALHQPVSFDNLVQNHQFKPYGVSEGGIFGNQTFSVPTLTSLTASSFGAHVKPVVTPLYGQSGVVSSTNLLTASPPSFSTSFPAGSSDLTPGIFNNKPFFLDTRKLTFPSVSQSLPTNFHFPINQVPIFPLATRPTYPIYGFPTTPVVKPVKPTYLYLLNSAK